MIIYKETKKANPGVSVSIQPSENRNTVAVHARNKQTNQDSLKNYNLATIHTDLPPPARAQVLLSSVARLGALELSQTNRLVPSPWKIPP